MRTNVPSLELLECKGDHANHLTNLPCRQMQSSIKINTGAFFWENVFDRRKNHGCGQQNPEGTSAAMFEVRLQPNATNSSDMFFNSIQCYASYWITINTGIFWGKICQTAAKSIIVDRKNRRALAMLCLTSGLRPNAANSSVMYFHSIRCYASYLTYASCDKHGSSSCTNVFGPSQKPWPWTEKNKGTSSCYVWRRDRCQMLQTQAMC